MSQFAGLQPQLRPYASALFAVGRQYGLNPVVTSTRRSSATQRRLFRRWQAGLSPYPAAVPGTSLHELGWAFDMWSGTPGGMEWLNKVWEYWGGVSGGKTDPVHYQPFPYTAPVR